jgi:hypothetical protein
VKRAARPIFEVAAPLVPIQGIPRSLVGRGLLGRRCCYPGVKNCGLLSRVVPGLSTCDSMKLSVPTDRVKVTDAPPVAVDFRADCLFVLRLGIGQPFQKIAEFIDAFGGRQMDPIIDGVRRCI